MVDMGRISSKKWAIALLVFLCVSAVLFIAPWILSVFYDSDPYENWKEEVRFNSPEEEGNLTLLCTPGPCVACTSIEKADASSKCSPTGYHRAQQCIEDRDTAGVLPTTQKEQVNSRLSATRDPVQGKDQKNSGDQQQASENFGGDTNKRQLLITEDGLHKTVIYKTCIPQEVKEKLSVFGFEGVVLVCLLLSAPAVHYRKKRGAASQGMQRIPSTARF